MINKKYHRKKCDKFSQIYKHLLGKIKWLKRNEKKMKEEIKEIRE